MGFEVCFTTEEKEELKKILGIAIDCGCSKIEVYNTPSFDGFPAIQIPIKCVNEEFLKQLRAIPCVKE